MRCPLRIRLVTRTAAATLVVGGLAVAAISALDD